MRVRRLWPAAFLLLVPALTGCSDDGGMDGSGVTTPTDSPSTPATSETSSAPAETTAPTESTSAAPAVLPAACDLITSDDVSKAFGGPAVAPGEPGGGGTSEGNNEWKSDNCSFEADQVFELTVKLTGPSDFSKGTFGCPQPSEISAIVEPADDIAGATGGWWKVGDAPPLEAELRACSADALVEVELEYEDGIDYDGDPRNQSAAIAELVLAALQG